MTFEHGACLIAGMICGLCLGWSWAWAESKKVQERVILKIQRNWRSA